MKPCSTIITLLFFGLAGCGRGGLPHDDYEFRVVSESDPGIPLSGVQLARDSLSVATTAETGTADFTLQGTEGDRVQLTTVCPEGYISEEKSVVAVLRSYAGGRVPELLVRCSAERSRLAVIVHVENGAHLPVQHRSRTLAVTDSKGIAHVLLEGTPGDTLELSLNTEEQPRIRPSNPSARFTLAGADDVALFEQRFLVEAPKRTFRHANRKKDEARPVRLR